MPPNKVIGNVLPSFQAQEAAVRASTAPRDDQQDLDKVLASLGVAPVSGEASVLMQVASVAWQV